LRRTALALLASSLSVSCFLNPKTDDLPGSVVGGPTLGDNGGIDTPGANEDPGDDLSPSPDDDGAEPPPDFTERPPVNEPDAGSELADTLGASRDAGDGATGDTGVDAD
jgi:hypothetical protein